MLTTLRDRFAKMMRQGMGADDMLAAGATKEFDARWGDPELFVSTAIAACGCTCVSSEALCEAGDDRRQRLVEMRVAEVRRSAVLWSRLSLASWLSGCASPALAVSSRRPRRRAAPPSLPSTSPAARAARSPTASAVTTSARRRRAIARHRRSRDVSSDAELWEKAVRKLRGGMMPPPGARRPDQAAVDAFVAALERSLDPAAAAQSESRPRRAASAEPRRVRQRHRGPARHSASTPARCCPKTTKPTASTTWRAC